MRVIWGGVIGALFALTAPGAFGATLAFEDNKLNFKSCEGAAITVRWRGNDFSLSEPGKSLGDAHSSFKFLGWDGSCKTASWDRDRAMFVTSGDGATKPSEVIRYVAPDGAKWAGMRAGDGFFVTLVASAGEEISNARVKEVASWLARTSKEFTHGANFAERLKAEAVE